MSQYKCLWIILGLVVAASFSVLGYFGRKAMNDAPPIPREVVTTDGRVLFDGETISDGQNVWQSIGGQQVGYFFVTWYARSAEFMQTGVMSSLRWMRAVGDSVFALGALLLGYFVPGLVTGTSYTKEVPVKVGEPEFVIPRGGIHAIAAD